MKIKESLKIFLTMTKIGLFTFGGGYAMIPLLHYEFLEKREYLTEDEFLDNVAVAESTPGPIAVNMATYIGYKNAGVLGAIFSTIGVCLPSIIIIFIISLFFDQLLANSYINSAFKGIQVCVIYLIFKAGLKMIKSFKNKWFNIVLFSLTCAVMLLLSLLGKSFSSIYYILIAIMIGLIISVINKFRGKENA